MKPFDPRWRAALDALQTQLLENPDAAQEFHSTRGQFGTPADDANSERDADRRHLEWFAFERPSDALGGVPLDVLRSVVLDPEDDESAAMFESLRTSRVSVFEVTTQQSADSFWCRDLLGVGEYPVHEAAAAHELEVGDLLVGRLFPRDELFLLSPAMGVFRDAALVAALRGDLESARAARRTTLRMAQSELERLFFGPGAGERDHTDPLADLIAAGLSEQAAKRLLIDLEAERESGATGHAITEFLNQLAFETEVDLGAVQRALLVAWSANMDPVDPPAATDAPTPTPNVTPADVASALETFDEGRREGRDLESLFQALETDLGLDDDAPEVDSEQAPDFPGVVAAVVEEFLWETETRDGREAAREHCPLRMFAEFNERVGVFEELGSQHAVEFFTRWIPKRAEQLEPSAWPELLASYTKFAKWVEDCHQHPLWSWLEPELEGLNVTVGRLAELATMREELTGAERFDVLQSQDTELVVRATDGEERTFQLDAARALVPGDRLELSMERGGEIRIGDVWPVLRARTDS